MGTSNKDRQAAFKERMRETGKRQITVWVNTDQEQQVKGLLAGDPLPVTNSAAALTEERDTLAHRNAEMLAELAALREAKYQKGKLEDEIESLRFDVDTWKYKKSQRIEELLAGRFLMQKRDLVPVFLVDYYGKPMEKGHQYESAVKSAQEFGRKAAVAATSISDVVSKLERKAQLLPGEKSVLEAARTILGDVHTQATLIKEGAKRSADKIKREDEARAKVARAAIATVFPNLQDAGILLMLSYQQEIIWDGNRRSLLVMRPETATVVDISYEVERLAEQVLAKLQSNVEKSIKAGVAAAEAAKALRDAFDVARPELEAKYRNQIDRIRACQVAAQLRRANAK